MRGLMATRRPIRSVYVRDPDLNLIEISSISKPIVVQVRNVSRQAGSQSSL
ncbi:hypothetical protein J2T07_000361 [Luteibacter jiangsuensis]|uniref:Uncharacterized protein n=1 Tax=Luteibacter jiangsuensis TaxID=637577 RepID=A0ABT9SW41_9GAMM|nr:hypothetical protein [Luteibacter jiangsuensis]